MTFLNSPVPDHAQVILFDLDGTLRFNQPDANHFLFDFVASRGIPDSLEQRRKAIHWAQYYWAHSPELQEDVLAFREMDAAFWQQYLVRKLKVFGCRSAEARLLAPGAQAYMSEVYQPVDWIPPTVPALLGRLKDQGHILGLVTNRSEPVDEYLEEVDLGQYFHLALAAGEIGIWKPNPGIFVHALKQLGVPPGQAIYVGDNYFADVIGAQNAGLRPVLFDPEGIFPEAGCTTIEALEELLQVLEPA
jgi:FMN phosphatase YigB (HAD superfamily)